MPPTNSERNVRAKDLLTPASAITAMSGSLAVYGATHIDSLKGVTAFMLARAGDKLDGVAARLLHQESDVGAIFDTAVDKLGIGLASIYGWKKEVIPRPAITLIAAKSLASVALTTIMAHNHPNKSFRPTTAGKLSMGAESVALIAYAGAKALETEKPEMIAYQKIARTVGHIALATTAISGTTAIIQYAKRAFDTQVN